MQKLLGIVVVLFFGAMIAIVIAASFNRASPVSVREAFNFLTLEEETCFIVFEDAWRHKNGEVQVKYHHFWTTPTGYPVKEESPESDHTLCLKGKNVVLFAGEIFPNHDVVMKGEVLYLRTDK